MWHVKYQGLLTTDVEGPFTDKQLIELAELGNIKKDTLLNGEDKTKNQWVTAQQVPKINQLILQRQIDEQRRKQELRDKKQELALQKMHAQQEMALEKQRQKQHKQQWSKESKLDSFAPSQQSMGSPAPVFSSPVPPPQSFPYSQKQTVVVNVSNPAYLLKRKDPFVAAILTFLFGPFGMLYSTVAGALTCMVIGFFVLPVVVVMSFGLGLILYIPYWIGCITWAVLAC